MFKIFRFILLAFLLWFLNVSFDKKEGNNINVNHPESSLTESFKPTLVQVKKNGKADSKEFFMNVRMVVSDDSQCRIDTVQVY